MRAAFSRFLHPSSFVLPLLPTDARLSGAFAARLADAEAERDSQRPSRIEAGGTLGIVECQTGKPPPTVADRVARHSHPDGAQALDCAPAGNDSQGRSIPSFAARHRGDDGGTNYGRRFMDLASRG